MGKSNLVWTRELARAITLALTLGAAPALAQTANTGLLGDLGGLRTVLGHDGITLGITDGENLLGSLSGGVKQGATLQGVTTATLQINTGIAFGLPGGTINISALQIHGQNLSAAYLDDLQAANGNEAEDTTRLWEFWYDQSFDHAQADIKLGQQSIDNEFIVSQYSGLFVNTMAGWPLIPSVDLYGGGPAYPLASLGARLLFKPVTNTTLLAGVFDDNPGGGAFSDDAQELDATGAKFNLHTGALFIAELQFAVQGRAAGTYKLGFWLDTGFFPDQRFGTDGISLAQPTSNGRPLMHKGDYSLYAVADQTVWQSSADAARSLNFFIRLMGAPAAQNLVAVSLNGGVTITAPLSGRDNDQAGLDFGLGKVSGRAAGLDEDAAALDGGTSPKRGSEELFELTYQAAVTPWLTMQPDIQYVVNPGAGILNPSGTARLHNELVGGVRAIATF